MAGKCSCHFYRIRRSLVSTIQPTKLRLNSLLSFSEIFLRFLTLIIPLVSRKSYVEGTSYDWHRYIAKGPYFVAAKYFRTISHRRRERSVLPKCSRFTAIFEKLLHNQGVTETTRVMASKSQGHVHVSRMADSQAGLVLTRQGFKI